MLIVNKKKFCKFLKKFFFLHPWCRRGSFFGTPPKVETSCEKYFILLLGQLTVKLTCSNSQRDRPLWLGLNARFSVCCVRVVVFGLYDVLLALNWMHGHGSNPREKEKEKHTLNQYDHVRSKKDLTPKDKEWTKSDTH